MKLFLSTILISFSFLASANSLDATIDFTTTSSIETTLYPGGPGKKSRKAKRTNKKRKRACGKWSRKSYAG